MPIVYSQTEARRIEAVNPALVWQPTTNFWTLIKVPLIVSSVAFAVMERKKKQK